MAWRHPILALLWSGTALLILASKPLAAADARAPRKVRFEQDTLVQGVPVRRGAAMLWPDGTVAEAVLGSPHTFRDLVLPAGAEVHLAQGGLRRAKLQAAQTIWGLALPAGSTITTWPSLMLGADTELFGIPLKKRAWVDLACSKPTEASICGTATRIQRGTLAKSHSLAGMELPKSTFFRLGAQGQILELRLTRNAVVKDLPASAGNTVRFHDHGRLRGLVLSKPSVISGFVVAAGHPVELYGDGRLANGVLAVEAEISGFLVAPGAQVSLHANGALAKGRLLKAATVHEVDLPAQTMVTLRTDGSLVRAEAPRPIQVQGVPARGLVTFHGNGRVQRLTVSRTGTIGKLPVRAGSEVRFHQNGSVESVVLARPVRIQGVLVKNAVGFWEDGTLWSAELAEAVVKDGVSYNAGEEIYLAAGESLQPAR